MQNKPAIVSGMAVAIVLILATLPQVRADGLNNTTKTFTEPNDISPSDWSDPKELERTWQAALVQIPDGTGRSIKTGIVQLMSKLRGSLKKYPTVIQLHGCGGLWSGTERRADFLANNGFLVIAPASFARTKYAKSCDIQTRAAGLYRAVLNMRQNDAAYAIAKTRQLPFVDQNNVFLSGHSEGAVVAATFKAKNPKHKVKARVVESWTCTALGWNEYNGVQAPKTEPVLTLLAGQDPWFQNFVTRGDCARHLSKTNGSRSLVYRDAPLSRRHSLLNYEQPQQDVLKFLKAQLRK